MEELGRDLENVSGGGGASQLGGDGTTVAGSSAVASSSRDEVDALYAEQFAKLDKDLQSMGKGESGLPGSGKIGASPAGVDGTSDADRDAMRLQRAQAAEKRAANCEAKSDGGSSGGDGASDADGTGDLDAGGDNTSAVSDHHPPPNAIGLSVLTSIAGLAAQQTRTARTTTTNMTSTT